MRTKLQPVMRTLASAAVFAVLGAASPALAQEGVAAAPDYDDGATWLCRPGREDSCAIDLTAAIIATDGSVAIETTKLRAHRLSTAFTSIRPYPSIPAPIAILRPARKSMRSSPPNSPASAKSADRLRRFIVR
jgi:hypothetical protein